MSAIDWGGLLRAAARMGVSPEDFWRMSVREWRLMTRGDDVIAMSRADLAELMQAYPDRQGD
jgi:uncharacterized phage protein (TIGR02216 family)